MTDKMQTRHKMAPDGAAGGYAAVYPTGPDMDRAGESMRRHIEAIGRHRLILRFILFNMSALALAGAAWTQGWVVMLLNADDTGLSLAIFLVFLAGLGICAHAVWEVGTEVEEAGAMTPRPGSQAARYLAEVRGRDSGSRATTASRLKLVLSGRISPVLQIANSLVLLGLIGTVVGFIVALSGVDPQTAGNADAIAPMVAELIHGMSIALYTTLVGAILHLWLKVNYLLLAGGVVQLLDRLVARGESHARL